MKRRNFLCLLSTCGLLLPASFGLSRGRATDTADIAQSAGTEPLAAPPVAAGLDRFWGINTDIKYRTGDDEYRRQVIPLVKDLQLSYVREGMLDVGGRSVDEPFNWDWLDRTLADLEAADLGLALALRLEDCQNPDDYGPKWEDNLRYRVRAAGERYAARVRWYMPWNEPDIHKVPPRIVLRVQEIAWQELKGVDRGLLLESAPLSSASGSGDMMYELCASGITRYADFLGCHAYHQVNDEGRSSLKHAWLAQQRANADGGHPILPVSVSENGYRSTIVSHPQLNLLKAHWAMLNLIQVKRYACAQGIIFALASPRELADQFCLTDAKNNFAKRQPEYDAYKQFYNASAWSLGRSLNGGFESRQASATDGWVVHYNPRELAGNPGPFAEWDRISFRTDENAARSGQGFCRMVAGGLNRVRRLVEGLDLSRSYTLTVQVRLTGEGALATLAAMGHNRLNGLDDRVASTGECDRYVALSLEFQPSNPWVVVSLEHNGQGVAYWDDVELV